MGILRLVEDLVKPSGGRVRCRGLGVGVEGGGEEESGRRRSAAGGLLAGWRSLWAQGAVSISTGIENGASGKGDGEVHQEVSRAVTGLDKSFLGRRISVTRRRPRRQTGQRWMSIPVSRSIMASADSRGARVGGAG